MPFECQDPGRLQAGGPRQEGQVVECGWWYRSCLAPKVAVVVVAVAGWAQVARERAASLGPRAVVRFRPGQAGAGRAPAEAARAHHPQEWWM